MKAIEKKFNFRFPPDLRDFLQTVMPVQIGFWDWRADDEYRLQTMMNWPLDGCLFDVEHNAFWLPEWELRPELLSEALQIATLKISEAPKLIPIYLHRYIPEDPHKAGNPVFSVHQMDIVY